MAGALKTLKKVASTAKDVLSKSKDTGTPGKPGVTAGGGSNQSAIIGRQRVKDYTRNRRLEGGAAVAGVGAVGATEAYKLGKRIAEKNLTNQEMIREFTEALKNDGASREEVSEKVEVFKNEFIKKGKPDVEFNKGGVIKKGYMGGGMANGKKHNYVAGGYVTDMMGKKKK